MKPWNERGMTLLEITVAGGLMGGLALAGITLFRNQTVSQKTIEQNYEVTAAQSHIRTILANKDNCIRNFGNKAPNTVNVVTSIARTANGVDVTPALYPVSDILPGTSIKINSYRLTRGYSNLAPGETMLVISFSRGSGVEKDQITKAVKINYELSAGLITSCFANTSGEVDSLWQLATNLTDIYYNSGKVTIGTSISYTSLLNVSDNGTADNMGITRYGTLNGPTLRLRRARGTQAAPTEVFNNNDLGEIVFDGYRAGFVDGGARISGVVDGAPGADSVPTAIAFTTGHNQATMTEKMRITPDGKIGIGTANPTASSHMHISDPVWVPWGQTNTVNITHNNTPTALSTHDAIGLQGVAESQAASNRNIGGNFRGLSTSTGQLLNAFGIIGVASHWGNDTVASSQGVLGYTESRDGTITSGFGGIFGVNSPSGTVTNGYGVFIDAVIATTKYGLYQQDATARNVFLGPVGIGIANPDNTVMLHAYSSGGRGITIEDPTNGGWLNMKQNATHQYYLETNPTDGFVIRRLSQTGTAFLSIKAGNDVGIGRVNALHKLHVQGNIFASGTITENSDMRLKKNVEPIEEALEKILTLNGLTYAWKKSNDLGRQMGVLAQDVEKVFPEAVLRSKDGSLSVSYSALVAPLIESVKEFNLRDLELKKRAQKGQRDIASMKEENSRLEAENSRMKVFLCSQDPLAPFCQ